MVYKPTMGYPSRIEAIKALRREGKTEREIGAILGIKPNTVTGLESKTKRRAQARRRVIKLSQGLYDDLARLAHARGTTNHILIREVLQEFVEGEMT